MNLSELVYLSVKNVIYYDNTAFTLQAFKEGTFDGSPDYQLNIYNVFSALNEAIARLSDLDRIPYVVKKVLPEQITGSMIYLDDDVKEVKALALIKDANYKKVKYSVLGRDKVLILDYVVNDLDKLFIEYKQDLPVFSKEKMQLEDINMKIYGINDSMCNYIIEYCQGKLQEPIAPELANMHITRSEQYFANIDPVHSAFNQQKVYTEYHIGD